MMKSTKYQGLVLDLLPNIRVMQSVGHWLFNYYSDAIKFPHRIYCPITLFLIIVQFIFMVMNLIKEIDDNDDLTANTITLLFFLHPIIKTSYIAMRNKMFYKTFAIWNNPNTHPLFAESNARYHSLAITKCRRILFLVSSVVIFATFAWTIISFIDEPVRVRHNKETNETIETPLPKLMIKTWYPFNSMSGMGHILALVYQFWFLFVCMSLSLSADLIFCSWILFACEQICHLKGIMKPLMELSATLDTVVPNSGELFKAGSADHLRDQQGVQPSGDGVVDSDVRGIYSNRQDFTATFRPAAGANFNGGVGPNGLSKKQEMLVRSAIKYWVERHKHVVRLVTTVGDTYGVALLLHMLVTTITLTLLAYQATKVNGVNCYAFETIGYLLYTLGQVFLFCIFGNRLIEESSSVMEAAYSCHWYDGSEEAKTFVQIVCQQCQKAMSISGAKFFTVSLDLFAS
ncbi:hypothetical protein QAD02_012222, partial [Eretmocerus hayati]